MIDLTITPGQEKNIEIIPDSEDNFKKIDGNQEIYEEDMMINSSK